MGIHPDALFSILLEDLECYLSRDDMSGAASRSLKTSFYKKFVANEALDAEEKALDKFSTINHRMRNFEIDSSLAESNSFIERLKTVLWKFEARANLGCLSYDHIFDRARTGPGAAIRARGGDFYTKVFDSPLSCTSESLLSAYRRITGRSARWFLAEHSRSSQYPLDFIVEGNTIASVPKTNEIRRTICIEPNINMMFQLGLGSYIESELRKQYSLDLAIQPDKNRELARRGSIDGSFGTIDLESASDSLCYSVLSKLFDRHFFGWLSRLRSPVSSFRDGSQTKLYMVSTMGNGFTFPLQTLLFAGCVIATALEEGKPISFGRLTSRSFGVFGDDIIVPYDLYDATVRNLELLGFKVNSSKSFNSGPFRESCGHDYHLGVNIRGVYAKSLHTMQDRFVLVNRLNDFTSRTGIPVRGAVKMLLSSVRFTPVPLGENDDAGIKVPRIYLKKFLIDKHTQSIRYTRFVAKSNDLVFPENGEPFTPKGEKKRSLNVDGAYLSFLQGSIRGHRCSVRLDRVRYSPKRGVSPNWDFTPMGSGATKPRMGLTPVELAYLLNCED
ncbi:TPA_asm: RNA-directed RNA polymerase [ssRNA phage Gerhypos.2_22]|uniref:RNA-directed RNA polymerase n=2 Tax=Norzivirales TaxID=2842247 RepID=A0A8S5KZC4_9VIRU|nr:RNA-directed RNA polymerase [ssRNA phage Gerhypos.2_22]QDH86512.1 MAG: RNA-dependent RNA polymerase [Leviviridae sp.]DAD50429.1 TPA_asm: RNA-directed RNA polymerase [ssRNA phage Gerhypos.2_22]